MVAVAVVTGGCSEEWCLSTPPPRDVDDAASDAPDDPDVDAPDDPDVDAPDDPDVDAPPGCVDEDGDGWPTGDGACGRFLDCADDNILKYPGALEDRDRQLDLDCVPGVMVGLPVADLQSVAMGSGRRITARDSLELTFHPNASHQLSGLNPEAAGQLLYAGPMAERWSGTNVWEDWYSTVATGTPEHTGGEVIVRWRVPWVTKGMSGSSVYTIHIDGRVQRRDVFQVTGEADSPVAHSVTSYVALNAAVFDDVTWEGPEMQPAPTPIAVNESAPFQTYFQPELAHDQLDGAPRWLCARHEKADVVWTHAAGNTAPGDADEPQPRITSSSDSGPQLALQYDWLFAQPAVPLGFYTGNFMLVVTGPSGGSVDCGYAGQIASSYHSPAHLIIPKALGEVDTTDPNDPTADVDDDGYVEAGGYYRIDVRGGTRLAVGIDLGNDREFAPVSTYHLENFSLDPLPVVTRTLPGGATTVLVHGQDYRFQADGPHAWLTILVGLPDGAGFEVLGPYQ
jgi:hypothetical protein